MENKLFLDKTWSEQAKFLGSVINQTINIYLHKTSEVNTWFHLESSVWKSMKGHIEIYRHPAQRKCSQ